MILFLVSHLLPRKVYLRSRNFIKRFVWFTVNNANKIKAMKPPKQTQTR